MQPVSAGCSVYMSTMKWAVLALLLAGVGCAAGDETQPGDDDAVEGVDNPGGKADFYGNDDRQERYQASASMQQWARSTALVVSTSSLFLDGNGNIRMSMQSWSDRLTGVGTGPLCEDERFQDQPAPGFCSAFLIAPDLVATAGHCVNESYSCEDIRFAFDFAYDHSVGEADVNLVPRDDFYQCRQVVGHLYDYYAVTLEEAVTRELWSDWAVIRLDRPVVGRSALPLRAEGGPTNGQRVYAIGHPGGIPSKVTGGRVVDDSHALYFNTDLDIFAGNSGSATFNTDGEVEGIVIRGTGGKSFVKDGNCYRSKSCDAYDPTNPSCAGNHVMRVNALRPFVGLDDIFSAKESGGGAAIPDGQGQFSKTLHISQAGSIRFVTANLLVAHASPSDLRIRVVRDTGHESTLFERPKLKINRSSYSATSHAFDGERSDGAWTVIVEDLVANGTSYSNVYDIELVVGVGGTVEPSAEQTFVGTPCVDDDACDFHAEAYCHRYGEAAELHGFCSMPCDGYCPDRAGFATTFCTSLNGGASGSCVSKAHLLNDDCDYLSGTTAQERERFVGTSTATPSQAMVCVP